jgi:amino acid transporter
MNTSFNYITIFIIVLVIFSIYFKITPTKKRFNFSSISIPIIIVIFISYLIYNAKNNEYFYTSNEKNKYYKLVNACTKLGVNTTEDHQITDCIYMLNNCKNNGYNHISKTIGGIECGPCFANDKQLCSNTICLNGTIQDGVCDVAINVNDYPLTDIEKTNYD